MQDVITWKQSWAKLDPCSKNTCSLNMKSQAFLSQMHLLLMSLWTCGSMVILSSEIIVSQWEGQETALKVITIIHSKKDISLIAERSNNKNVRSEILFQRYEALDKQRGQECESKARSGSDGLWQNPKFVLLTPHHSKEQNSRPMFCIQIGEVLKIY